MIIRTMNTPGRLGYREAVIRLLPFHRYQGAHLDPPESWELGPCDPGRPRHIQTGFAGFPYIPHTDTEVDQHAVRALETVCGNFSLEDILVIPATTRRASPKGPPIITPDCVLAMGSEAVALWVRQPEPHLAQRVSVSELALIDNTRILLYCRLRLRSRDSTLSVRYNAVAYDEFSSAVNRLRGRVADTTFPVPGSGPDLPEALPYKWKPIANSPMLTGLYAGQRSLAFAESLPRGRTRHRIRRRGTLLAVTAREIVIAQDPVNAYQNYGVDVWYVPRERLRRLESSEGRISFVTNGTTISVDVPPRLTARASFLLKESAPRGAHTLGC